MPTAAAANTGCIARPYLPSLPALLVCVGILVPFFTALWHSTQRYNLAMPYLRGFIGADHYLDFLSDGAFWNTLRVSATYMVATVGVEWVLGLAVALVDVWVYTPFMVILLLAGLRSLPPQPFDAVRLDGVPACFVFFRITLPMLTPSF